MMFLFSIHGDTMIHSSSFIETPINSNMFGWDRRFQVMTSRQNLCKRLSPVVMRRLGQVNYPLDPPDII